MLNSSSLGKSVTNMPSTYRKVVVDNEGVRAITNKPVLEGILLLLQVEKGSFSSLSTVNIEKEQLT
jgi:hypothetical protein